MLKGKRILITGGAGSIGAMLVRQLAPYNKVLIFDIDDTRGYDLAESLRYRNMDVRSMVGDIRDSASVNKAFAVFQPEIVLHAAALKTVASAERHQREYAETNIMGLLNVLDATDAIGAKLVFISTDKSAGPTGAMGGTKLVGEIFTKGRGHIVVRFGNVMGSQGSLLPLWQGQIDRKEPMTITDPDCERYFMTIDEACTLIIKASEEGQPGQTLIFGMGQRIKIGELAQQIIENTRQSIETKIIGLRPGETLIEKIMTYEEEARSVKKGDFWFID